MKIFKKELFIKYEGKKSYFENQMWVDKCDNKPCIFRDNKYGTCYVESDNYSYMVYNKWCKDEKEVIKNEL